MTFLQWAKNEIEEKNLSIPHNLLEKLLIITNYDSYAFINEIKKFKLLNKKEINEKDIEELTNDIHDYDIWAFIDAINKKDNRKEIIEIIEKFIEKEINYQYLLSMIARNIKQIIITKKLLE